MTMKYCSHDDPSWCTEKCPTRPVLTEPKKSSPQTGRKDDTGKPRTDLLSSIALIEISKVLAFGCGKYAPNNWREGIAWGRVIAAALRHIFAWMRREDKDFETGLSHLAHAACCLMFLLEYEETRKEFDDRYERR